MTAPRRLRGSAPILFLLGLSGCGRSFLPLEMHARSVNGGVYLARSTADVKDLIAGPPSPDGRDPRRFTFVPGGTRLVAGEEWYLVEGKLVRPFFASPADRSRRGIFVVWKTEVMDGDEVGTKGWVLERDIADLNTRNPSQL